MAVGLPGLQIGLTKGNLEAAIRALFAAGEQGVWYDPSDFSTMFQDSAGTTPVTAVGQPVGLWLDKRLGLARGPDVTNGGFDVDANWTKGGTWTINGGQAHVGATAGNLTQTYGETIAVGDTFEITWTSTNNTGILSAFVGGAVQTGTPQQNATSGAYRVIVQVATLSGQTVGIAAGGGVPGGDIDNLSIRKIRGNHATQSTTANRPTLQQDGSGYYYLSFNGTNSGLFTPANADFTASNKLIVCAGVTKSADQGGSVICELSGAATAIAGGFGLDLNGYAANGTWMGGAVGGTPGGTQCFADGPVGSAASPVSAVFSLQGDLTQSTIASQVVLRKNSVALTNSATGGTATAAGNFTSSVLNIGARALGTAPNLFLNGRIYQLVIRGGTAVTSPTQLERFVGQKMGIAL